MIKSINGTMFRKMILAGASLLEENKKYVDSLNVFPVPDGDTGTNMSMTMKSVVTEISKCQVNDLSSLCRSISLGGIKGARGNSGTILSQILKGMCIVIGDQKEINVKILSKAIAKGSEVAYQAVTKPKEGTILTVISAMAEASIKAAKKTTDLETFLNDVIEVGDTALKNTPELLPVLKKAGVVDSGGQGLMIIFAGFLKALTNDESFEIKMDTITPTLDSVISNPEIHYENLADIEFGYCTEFMIIEMKKKTTLADIELLKRKLMEIGDSVLCLGDLELVKIHVHTNTPNIALQMALELGELHNIKIENMREENRELKRIAKSKEPEKQYGIVSICTGEGFKEIFTQTGADYCIEGGQTMNPSSDDIAKAIDKVNAKEVFVLPNNKNIIMAANQAKDLTSKIVHVIGTVNVPQGIAACLAMDQDATTEENIDNITEAYKRVNSGSVTHSVRKANISGFKLDVGDIIGLNDKGIVAHSKNVDTAVETLVEKINNPDNVSMTLYYGEDISEEDATALGEKLQNKYPDKEVQVIPGGQPLYYYIISLE